MVIILSPASGNNNSLLVIFIFGILIEITIELGIIMPSDRMNKTITRIILLIVRMNQFIILTVVLLLNYYNQINKKITMYYFL